MIKLNKILLLMLVAFFIISCGGSGGRRLSPVVDGGTGDGGTDDGGTGDGGTGDGGTGDGGTGDDGTGDGGTGDGGYDKWGYDESPVQPNMGEGNFYLIEIAENLVWIANQINFQGNIKFMTNLDMNGRSFAGIKSFSGIMDGNNKKIKNLSIRNLSSFNSFGGLVGKMNSGEIKNLIIESGDITGYGSAGSFVGRVDRSSGITLTGLTNYAEVETRNYNNYDHVYAGGIIGLILNSKVTITGVYNEGTVRAVGTGYSGGIVGMVENGSATHHKVTIEKAMNKGYITALVSSGGIVGIKNNVPNLIIKNVGNAGTVESTFTAPANATVGSGGIIGFNNGSSVATIEKSYNYKAVKSHYLKGGILGFQNQNLVNMQNAITLSVYHDDNATAVGGGYATITGASKISKSLFANKSTFHSWNDFDTVWEIKSGAEYPTLK